jgi:hypothetical protein
MYSLLGNKGLDREGTRHCTTGRIPVLRKKMMECRKRGYPSVRRSIIKRSHRARCRDNKGCWENRLESSQPNNPAAVGDSPRYTEPFSEHFRNLNMYCFLQHKDNILWRTSSPYQIRLCYGLSFHTQSEFPLILLLRAIQFHFLVFL